MARRLKSLLTEGLAFVAESPGSQWVSPRHPRPTRHSTIRGRSFARTVHALPYFSAGRPKYLRCVTLGVVRRCRGRGIEPRYLEALSASLRLGFAARRRGCGGPHRGATGHRPVGRKVSRSTASTTCRLSRNSGTWSFPNRAQSQLRDGPNKPPAVGGQLGNRSG